MVNYGHVRVDVLGELERPPKVSDGKFGKTAFFRVRVVERGKKKDEKGEFVPVDVSTIVPCKAQRNEAECVAGMKPGDPISVVGKLTFEEWEKDGKKNSMTVVKVEHVVDLIAICQRGGEEKGAAPVYPPPASASKASPDVPMGDDEEIF